MKHPQATISKHAIDNMEVVSSQISPQQFIHIVKPALTADLEWAACRQLIEVSGIVSMVKG
jgi:hypothetical protein